MATLKQAEGFIQSGRYEEALREIHGVLHRDGEDWYPRYLGAFALRALGTLEESLEWSRLAADKAPDEAQPRVLLNMGVVLQVLERYEEAIEVFRQALVLDPTLTNAYNSLGLTHKLAGDLDKAEEVYEEGLLAICMQTYAVLGNDRSNAVVPHQDVAGDVCVEQLMIVALRACAHDGIEKLRFPTGEMAKREERTHEHGGLYFIDHVDADEKCRLYLPNYFSTMLHALRANPIVSVILHNIGVLHAERGNTESAAAYYRESIEFIPPGSNYQDPYIRLRELNR